MQLGLLFLGSMLLNGCTYVGDISGYIQDADEPAVEMNGNLGINGAVVRAYFKEPESALDPNFELETSQILH